MPEPVEPIVAPTPVAPTVEPKPAEPSPPGGGGGDEDKFDNPGGPKALAAEREARAAAEKELQAYKDREAEAEKAKLSDIERAQADAKTSAERASQLERDNWRLAALADYPVSKENRDLLTGTDADSYIASAKRLHELEAAAAGKQAPRPGYVPRSGADGGDPNPSGGSIAAGREKYAAKKK